MAFTFDKKMIRPLLLPILALFVQACSGKYESDIADVKDYYAERTASEFNPIITEILKKGSLQEVNDMLHVLNVKAKLNGHLYSSGIIQEIDRLLLHSQEFIRHKASSAAIGLGKRSLPMKEHLTELVDLNAGASAFFAAEALGAIGKEANSAQYSLARAILNTEARTREYACVSLRKIGLLDDEVLIAIEPFLDDDNAKVAINIAGTMILNDHKKQEARIVLERGLASDSDYANRWVFFVFNDLSDEIQLEDWAESALKEFGDRTNDVNYQNYVKKTLDK